MDTSYIDSPLPFSSFILTSIPASFGKQLYSVLLKISYCKFVLIFHLHLPHLPGTNTQLINS